jgi:hypothetical protein
MRGMGDLPVEENVEVDPDDPAQTNDPGQLALRNEVIDVADAHIEVLGGLRDGDQLGTANKQLVL